MRRTAALLLAALLVLAACGGSSGGGSADEAAGGACPVDSLKDVKAPVQVDYWYGGLGAGLNDAMQELIKQYNASQTKVHVTGQYQGTYDEAAEKYLTALRGGKLPQMVLLEDTRLQLMIDSKSVVPAQACVDADDYDLSDHLPAVIQQFSVKDQLWPVPFNVSNPVLFYDENDFVKAGLDPADPPKTFEDVLAAARKIKASGAAKTGYAWEMKPWYLEQWFAKAGVPLVDHDNGRSGRAEKPTLESRTGKQIYDFVEQLFDEGLAVNVGRNESSADQLLAVGGGQAAMAVGTTASLGTIYQVQEGGQYQDVKVGVAPLYGPSAGNGGVTVGGGSLWIVGKGMSDAQKAASWDFGKWLDEPQQQAHWHALTGYVPIRKSAVKLPEVTALWKKRPTYRVAYDQLAASHIEQGGPAIGPYKEFRDALIDSLEAIVLRKTPAAQALAQAQSAATEAFSSYNERVGG